ncbi:MAG: hypothetical protein UY21_C0006G0016 [Microgenomates group bacterium GW2011_GWA1_48_10]|uniref:Helix-turn-helix type 11 domain-containing protein n=1 Tax=Candidatus Gottesmanbacteria bacterium RIFCSPHIGHO2_01_FULL_47_48 TaxID=1798381 RepID=A0A1F6A4N4_9BACT|nr:MAG: hypothetical protein UY21_C0006G0016 [Microgenomates group bacterium GW2011_GWA1_48_10]OGG19402.1 MAG: hypothetical protein A2721_02650 [Candidatus Gottesmanbacteria bacterium RIFCSPHIGHO2_01_FULL_47_48]
MKKIELIWREILENGQKDPVFEQKELASRLGLSTSTVFAALEPLRAIGAVTVGGRGFRLTNFSKVLFFWATHRNLAKDIVYKTRVDLPMVEIEGLVDNETIYGAYSAGRRLLGQAPADYDKVYLYASKTDNLIRRFPRAGGAANVFVLQADPGLPAFGKMTPVSQTFVDLWNLPDWFAQDFLEALKEKFYGGLLS